MLAYMNPINWLKSQWHNRAIISGLAKRDIALRYKGSFLGLFWSLILPIIQLIIYSFVFSVVFKAKWGIGPEESKLDFALTLFSGLIVFNLFSEMMNRSSSIILQHQNYVKKVVFPLETLPVSLFLSTLIQMGISFVVLLFFQLIFTQTIYWTLLLVPLVLIPAVFVALGFGYFLASLGVFIRDIPYVISIFMNMLFYLTPIFYPVDAVPTSFRPYMYFNPFTYLVETFRMVVEWGQMPDLLQLILWIVGSLLFMLIGYAWFMASKRGFADVM